MYILLYLYIISWGYFVKLDLFYAVGDATQNQDKFLGCTHIKCIGTVEDCIFLVSDEDGLPLRVSQVMGTLKIGPFLQSYTHN